MTPPGDANQSRPGATRTGEPPKTPEDYEYRDEFGNLEANLRFLHDSDRLSPGIRMLEIGTGKGQLLRRLLDLGYDIVGCEVSDFMLAEAHRLHVDLPVQKVDGATLPYDDHTFDVVMSFDVLEHIPDTDHHLSEIVRVLSPGAVICSRRQTSGPTRSSRRSAGVA